MYVLRRSVPGPAGPGSDTILWLHGGMVAGWMWNEQIERLPQFHHLVPDYPGIGRSGEQPHLSLDQTANELSDVAREAASGGRVHLVGLSLGAVVGVRVLALSPGVFARAVLSGPLTRKIPKPIALLQSLMLALYHRPRLAGLVARAFQLPADVRGDFLETAENTRRETYTAMFAELGTDPLPTGGVQGIEVPCLLVTGEKDTALTKASVVDLDRLLPHSRALFARGVGHQWNAENGKLFAEMVDAWVSDRDLPDGLVPAD